MFSIHFFSVWKDLVAKCGEVALFCVLIQTTPWCSFRILRGEEGGSIKLPKHVSAPEMIRQNCRILRLFHLLLKLHLFFCPEKEGQEQWETEDVFAAFPDIFTKMHYAKALAMKFLQCLNVSSQMKQHLAFPMALLYPVEIPNPSVCMQGGCKLSSK